MDSTGEKPSMDEFLATAQEYTKKYLSVKYARLPQEHKEEIIQVAMIRAFEAFERLDPSKSWKGFLRQHCRGAVLDFLKAGKGFEEDKWTLANKEGQKFSEKLNSRVSITRDSENESLTADQVAGIFGVATDPEVELGFRINWDLLSKLASMSDSVRMLAMHLRGFTLEEVGNMYNLTAQRVQQLILETIEKIKSPRLANSPIFYFQVMFALGVCELLNYPAKDYGIGWDQAPVNLDSDQTIQLNFFGNVS